MSDEDCRRSVAQEERLSALHDSHARFAAAETLAGLGSWSWDEATDQLTWSPQMYALLGLRPQDVAASYEGYLQRVHTFDRRVVEQAIQWVFETGDGAEFDHRIVRPNGQVLWLRGRATIVREGSGEPIRLVGTVLDVTADRQDEEQTGGHRERLAVLASVTASTDECMIVTSPEGTILSWNAAAERLYGYRCEESVGRSLALILSNEQLSSLPEIFGNLRERGHVRIEGTDLRRDGTPLATSLALSQVLDEDGEVTALVGIARELRTYGPAVGPEIRHAGQLARLAFQDPLTGLGNRWLLQDRLAQAVARRGERPTCVLLLDLDDFKTVNDVSGHAAGDQLLIEVARRLSTCVRAEDTVARLGGDEFVILLHDTEPDAAADRVLDVLAQPLTVEGRQVVPSASVGIAQDDGTGDVQALLMRADLAMYAAKAAGRGRAVRFSPDMALAVRERSETEAALRRAVVLDEIVVHFQPIVNVQAEAVTRVEALVRWQRPDGLVPPGLFLPLAEKSGLIVSIGREVLRQTCQQLRDWLAADGSRTVAVNASTLELLEPDFAEHALTQLAANGVRPDQLVLEVTESLFFEAEGHVLDTLAALRGAGVQVSIDDFGTGYSSLGRLQWMPLDSLKIDKSFVELITTGNEDLPILTSMVVMAHSLGLDVTAEGVETQAQAVRLIALGCDYLQGYHFGRPQAAATAVTSATEQAGQLLRALVGSDLQACHVLLIEDDPVSRLIVEAALSAGGFDVTSAATGAEGLCLLADQPPPACVLVDLGLPDTDGVAIVGGLRAQPRFDSTAVVVLTGAARRDVKAAAFAAGADDFVVKPVLPQHLTARVRGVIRSARMESRTSPVADGPPVSRQLASSGHWSPPSPPA